MRAKTVYESLDFERGRDPKVAMGIGKFASLVNDLSEFYNDILPSYNLSFNNIPSADLDREPHKLVITVDPIKKDGERVRIGDYKTIREMVKEFGWSSSDRITSHGFYPVSTKIDNKSVFKIKVSPIIVISYDEANMVDEG